MILETASFCLATGCKNNLICMLHACSNNLWYTIEVTLFSAFLVQCFLWGFLALYYSMYKLSWILKNSKKKLKVDFSSKQITFYPTRWLMMTVKASTTDTCDLTPIHVQERTLMKHAFLKLLHWKWMGKSLIGCKFCAKHLNKNIFSGSRSTTN